MCGICGIVNTFDNHIPDIHILRKMIVRLKHRGPDSCGYYRDKHVALGHTRLAIIDLESGAQPMCNEDGSIWITYNGEIYNYIEIGSKLQKLGHKIQTKSDTEIIIHAYEEWGTDCFTRFNGQWAMAIWDSNNQKVILSRDRFGIRPLFYTIDKKRLLFSSEIKALFIDLSIERKVDAAGIDEIFTFWCPIAPQTVFKDILKLEPGHFLTIKDGKISKKPYWKISFSESYKSKNSSEEKNAELIKQYLINASRLRFLRSDVPVAAYISGGIDSSIIASLITHYTNSPLKTFSLRFSDEEFDEGQFQREIVEKLGTIHRDVRVSYKDIGEIFPSVIWHTERPILRTAPAPLFLLSRLVHDNGYKVVVTGEGSDEVLAGYDIFLETKVRHFLARDPFSNKRIKILNRLYPWMQRSPSTTPAFAHSFFTKKIDSSDPVFSHRTRWDTTSLIKYMLTPDFRIETGEKSAIEKLLTHLPDEYLKWDPLCKAQWLEYVTLLSGYILSAQCDRMLMAHAVEGRFPFLDCNFVELANSLPPNHKILALDEKHLLKIAFHNIIPESILKRPKQPYRAPDAASFFFSNSFDWIDDLTSESSIKKAGIFDHNVVTRLISKCRRMRGIRMSNSDNMRIVGVLSTMLIYHYYILNNSYCEHDEILPKPVKIVDKIKQSN